MKFMLSTTIFGGNHQLFVEGEGLNFFRTKKENKQSTSFSEAYNVIIHLVHLAVFKYPIKVYINCL